MMPKKAVIILSISFVILGIFITAASFHRQFYDKMYFKKAILKTNEINRNVMGQYLSCELSSSMGKYTINMSLNIPCKNEKQFQQLQRALPGIKSDMIIQLSSIDMENNVDQGNLDKIKYTLLQIINNYSSKPVEDIYLNKFWASLESS